ncbi:MAG: helix-turn-helix domain-containing protein [Rhodospirillaceae bacterium]|nr:helix-turn-helix domain-containing protein [Rhodospirillaceae bacterium]
MAPSAPSLAAFSFLSIFYKPQSYHGLSKLVSPQRSQSIEAAPEFSISYRDFDACHAALSAALVRFNNIFGDPWSVLILRDCFLGISRFTEFLDSTGITRQTLSARLKELTRHGVLHRVRYNERPARYEYRLTPKGLDLHRFAYAVWKWSVDWSLSPPTLPTILFFRKTLQPVSPILACSNCQTPLVLEDLVMGAVGRESLDLQLNRRARRWAGNTTAAFIGDTLFGKRTFIIGDRWVGLILASVLLGVYSFDRLADRLGIATNILAHRLKMLTEYGLLSAPVYEPGQRCYEYRPTQEAAALVPLFLAISEWVTRWETPDGAAPPVWWHRPCGAAIKTCLVDETSGGRLLVSDIRFSMPIKDQQ